MSDPGSATRSTGAAAISCFALTQHALEGLVEELRRQPVADCQQFIILEDKAGAIAELHLFIPAGGFRVLSSLLARVIRPVA